jgi:hypothetical protein
VTPPLSNGRVIGADTSRRPLSRQEIEDRRVFLDAAGYREPVAAPNGCPLNQRPHACANCPTSAA